MKVMVLDTDTTGLEKDKDFIWHTSYLLFDTKSKEVLAYKERLYDEKGSIGKDAEFLKDLQSSNGIVSHNLDFDKGFLRAELGDIYSISYGKKAELCTMKKAKDIIKIYDDYLGDYKFPKLIEAYKHLKLKERYTELHSLPEKRYNEDGKMIVDEAGVKAIMAAKLFFHILGIDSVKISNNLDRKVLDREEFMEHFHKFYYKNRGSGLKIR